MSSTKHGVHHVCIREHRLPRLSRILRSILQRFTPIDGFTFHSWRHTFRTRLAEAGVSDEIAKRLGGWTVDKTAARYDHDGRLKELRHAINLASGTASDNERSTAA